MLLIKPYHMHTFCVCWHEASLSLTLITPLSAHFKETCILPVSCNSRCLPDKALIVSAQLSVKGASLCPCSCSCWANGSVSTVGRQQQCSQGLTAAMCGTGAHQHRLITPSLPRAKRDLLWAVFYLFTHWMWKWTLLQFKSQVRPVCLSMKNTSSIFKQNKVWPQLTRAPSFLLEVKVVLWCKSRGTVIMSIHSQDLTTLWRGTQRA